MSIHEKGSKRNSRFRIERPWRKRGDKSPEFKTFAATLVEVGRVLRKSPGTGFEDLKSWLSDDSKKGEDK